jgi:hypothetical protein
MAAKQKKQKKIRKANEENELRLAVVDMLDCNNIIFYALIQHLLYFLT